MLDGSTAQLLDNEGKTAWRSNNAKVISWLLNSVQVDIAMGLRSFVLASEMWEHLYIVYTQCNLAQEFELERSLVEYVQGEKYVCSFHSGLLAIWSEQDQNFATSIPAASLVVQFLMKFRSKFEYIRANLLNRETTPDIDMVLSAVLKEETCLGMQSSMDTSLSVSTALLASRSNSTSTGKPSQLQCFQCKEYGHIAAHSFQAIVPATVTQSSPFDSTELQHLIQEYVAVALPRAISTALSASYAGKLLLKDAKVWHIDSAASNHMTGNSTQFSTLSNLSSKHDIVTANANNNDPQVVVAEVPTVVIDYASSEPNSSDDDPSSLHIVYLGMLAHRIDTDTLQSLRLILCLTVNIRCYSSAASLPTGLS
ncbi:hypothetical protein CDL12_16238 [Handroanthus impetiginosus]|uniref:Retrovirus-related Pol polyprotein from transposon TNT 1-94-like beta-barrel domain-containing protein n=1 Tax=Handroanthus impetiginosus TaxID=429701 RepID=A0A2G9H0Y3_9LAMI|nr:hypothetical protein CDL12_16238 [Handroanthus impetiginosus]